MLIGELCQSVSHVVHIKIPMTLNDERNQTESKSPRIYIYETFISMNIQNTSEHKLISGSNWWNQCVSELTALCTPPHKCIINFPCIPLILHVFPKVISEQGKCPLMNQLSNSFFLQYFVNFFGKWQHTFFHSITGPWMTTSSFSIRLTLFWPYDIRILEQNQEIEDVDGK